MLNRCQQHCLQCVECAVICIKRGTKKEDINESYIQKPEVSLDAMILYFPYTLLSTTQYANQHSTEANSDAGERIGLGARTLRSSTGSALSSSTTWVTTQHGWHTGFLTYSLLEVSAGEMVVGNELEYLYHLT